jgi:ferredoxin
VTTDPYKRLAERLDALPAGYPAAADGAELRVLAALFTPEQAALAADLSPTLETPAEIAARAGRDPKKTATMLKAMARAGLIGAGRAAGGLGYRLMPFAVGFYEMQGPTLDAELARRVEEYFQQSMGEALAREPQAHRVIPVNRTVEAGVEVHPYESAADILAGRKAWGVVDCICRKQKALIGDPCEHPLDVCLAMSDTPGAFDAAPHVRALTLDEALATLHRAAEAGLVHTVGNTRDDVEYVCNCCTCSCGILRGMAELGMANVVARSAFVNRVDEALCAACGTCVDACSFSALALDDVAHVDAVRCVGCGVCVLACPDGALALVRRPADEVMPPPATHEAWGRERLAARGLALGS